MTNKNKGLKLAEKILFVLSAIFYFISNFLYLSSHSSPSYSPTTSVTVTILITVGILPLAFLIGFFMILLMDKKYYALGTGLFLSAPLCAFILDINQMITTSYFYVGTIMLIICIVLYIASAILHGISSFITSATSTEDIEKRIEIIETYKKFKDEGIISEEEFQMKKEEILNITKKKVSKK